MPQGPSPDPRGSLHGKRGGLLGALRTETVALDAYAAPGRLSRSEEEYHEGLNRLGGIVRSIDAELGLWIDPGGEVISLIDNAGQPLSPELTQIVLVQLALEQLGIKRIAIPVTSPAKVAQLIDDLGGDVIWTKTEHHAMMASAAAAEMVAGSRGEFIFSDFIPAYDGMFAAVKLLEGLARGGVRLHDLATQHPELHMRQQRVSCPWGRKGTVMRRLTEETEHENRQLVDGVKVWKNQHEWVLIIPHSHKPYFVVTVEGSSPERADELLARYTSQVEAWRDEA